MAGKTPSKAVQAFAGPIQRALTCFVDGRVQVDSYDPSVEGVLQFNGGDAVRLGGSKKIHLFVSMRYVITQSDDEQKPWKVHTTGWAHSVLDRLQDPVIDFIGIPSGLQMFSSRICICIPKLSVGTSQRGAFSSRTCFASPSRWALYPETNPSGEASQERT